MKEAFNMCFKDGADEDDDNNNHEVGPFYFVFVHDSRVMILPFLPWVFDR
jgi:hypothetical protein